MTALIVLAVGAFCFACGTAFGALLANGSESLNNLEDPE